MTNKDTIEKRDKEENKNIEDNKNKIENKDILDNSTYDQIIINETTNSNEELIFKRSDDSKNESEIYFKENNKLSLKIESENKGTEENKNQQMPKEHTNKQMPKEHTSKQMPKELVLEKDKNKQIFDKDKNKQISDDQVQKNISNEDDQILKKMKKEDLDPSQNIFNTTINNTQKFKKSSSFINNKISKVENQEENKIEEISLGEKIFECKCNLYKFLKKWEKINSGTIYVYKQDKLRVLFIKNEFLTVSFDFYLEGDIKAYIKNRGVGFLINKENVLLMFDDDKKMTEFYELIK